MKNILDFLNSSQEDPGLTQQILTERLQPDFQDVGNSALASVGMGRYVDPNSFADSRLQDAMKQMQTVAQLQKIQQGNNLPASLQLANEYQKARASGDTQRMSDIAQFSKIYDKGIAPDASGGIQPLPGYAPAITNLAQAKSMGTERGQLKVKKEGDLPKATSALQSALQGNDVVQQGLGKAMGQSGAFTTGIVGSMTKNIPGTDAYNLNQTLATVKANLGFDKLAQMRANSPTGGALGQVSDFENKLLQSVYANLEQSQTKDQFESNLRAVGDQYKRSMNNLRQAYQNDYGNTDGFDQMFNQLPQQQDKVDPRIQKARDSGYSDAEIQQYLGGGQ